MASNLNIHKQNAMGGLKMAKGGRVMVPLNPLTEAKRENGVPGMKKGGAVCKCKGKCTCKAKGKK